LEELGEKTKQNQQELIMTLFYLLEYFHFEINKNQDNLISLFISKNFKILFIKHKELNFLSYMLCYRKK
jgi:hypothetical protein